MIARVWHGAVALDDGAAYAAHLSGEDGRMEDYTDIPGNVGAWCLRRDVGGKAEFMMFSLWESMEAVKAYAGSTPGTPVYYDKDKQLLIDPPDFVSQYEVVANGTPRST